AATQSVLEKGKRNVEILKQPQYSPVPVEKQVAIIYLGTQGLLRSVPAHKIKEFEEMYLTTLERTHGETLTSIRKGQLSDEVLDVLKKVGSEVGAQFK
ncbi:MAG: F0F1 ATP synthase subunit alpha, partial [Saprospiraceae bacterium]|nr:F0F1 ATP synthase subunit alpha [Saprospiraceae bacterium]